MWRGTDEDKGEREERGDPLRPSALRAFRRAFRFCYDHLGMSLAVNLGILLMGFLGFLGGTFLFPSGVWVTPSLLLMLSVGVFIFVGQFILVPAYLFLRVKQGEELRLRGADLRWRDYLLRGMVLVFLNSGTGLILLADLAFFLTRPSLYLQLVAIPFAYLFALWAVAQPYGLPLMMQGFPPLAAFRQMYLLVLDNPVFTGTVSFVIIALVTLSGLWVPFMLVTPMIALTAAVIATSDLLRKYDALLEIQHGGYGGARRTPDP